jgi:hypothetical protein
MKINLNFDLAWSDIYELCYDVWKLNDKFYLIGIEFDGCNLTSIMTRENDTLVQTLNKWNSSEYIPQTDEEQSEYLLAYTRLVEYVLDNNTFHLNNHFGPCILIRDCYIIYTHSIYQFDVDDEEWHRLQDNYRANPVIFEMWKEFCKEQENK